MTLRLYRMTIATHWYDQPAKRARSFEGHFKVARYGNITTVRKKLADKGVPFFQRVIKQRYGVSIPGRKMRVSFEREEPAQKIDREVQVEFRGMEFRGKHYSAVSAPSRILRYVRRRRRRVRK
jgi:hypothetical protein